MIIKASQRSGGAQLAAHLLNMRDNDHVTVLELRGFIAEDLRGAFEEAHAISKATRCTQFLFSVSFNPPEGVIAKEEDFIAAAEQAEQKLGLGDHASRAIGDWIQFYNHRRPHQALDMKTPTEAFNLAA